ncbi:MAG: aromatic-L-amino-acid/L-tryptophan decarboxylase [Solirubrobacteraceae bacterium]|nr:aromatic-L-amino-acid/L-tryptophan decarboxylase [Solirubrobacteraceae bacterium]
MGDLDRDPLGLGPEELRELGYRTIDLLVDQLTDPSIPAMRRFPAGEVRRRLSQPPPEQPRSWPELLQQTADDVLAPMSRLAHPGYFAFIPASSTFPGALGDLIAGALDIDAGSWMAAAGPSQVELVVLDWFKSWIGYPAQAAGILVSGGSAANVTALACAREALLGPMSDRVVAYTSDQTHSSVAKAARLLGFRPDQVRILPTDGEHRLRLDALIGAIDADAEDGRQPLLVSANAGSTNTGAVDQLVDLSAICRERGMWLHADAAYGGFAALTERGRDRLAGLELADSVTLDPHKWLYQPIECGCLLVREGHLLKDAFTINPDYLADYKSEEVNFADLGLQLTRTSRALKIWLSFNYYGTDAFRRAIDRSLDLAQLAERHVADAPTLELLSPATLGIICFRRRVDGVHDEATIAQVNADLVAGFEATGRGLVSSTRLHGKYAIRLCVMNHTSGPRDVTDVLDWFATAPMPAPTPAQRAEAVPRSSYEDEHADVRGGWAEATEFDEAAIRSLPLFADLQPGALEIVRRSARSIALDAGETVIRRWEGTRHFYTIVAGTVRICTELEELRELGPGEFFGEVAALDWGAGFGYARTATVVANSPLELLVLSPAAVRDLIRWAPEVERRLRKAARERLPTI